MLKKNLFYKYGQYGSHAQHLKIIESFVCTIVECECKLDDNYSSELGMSRWFMAVEKYVRYKAIMRGNRRKNAAIIIIL